MIGTIQRIENGETEPRGDSLNKLAVALDVPIEELVDWSVKEDKRFLIGLTLSALSFILFPALGILVPLIIWILKKDEIRRLNDVAKGLLNFQITWTIIFFIGWFLIYWYNMNEIPETGDISPALLTTMQAKKITFIAIMYLYNFIMIVINTVLINIDKKLVYFPKIGFIKK